MDWEEQEDQENRDPMEVEEEGQEEDEMNVDDMPVTQEDAWAVIRYRVQVAVDT